jgi:hypothetical protein
VIGQLPPDKTQLNMSCKTQCLDFTFVRNEGREGYTGDGILDSADNELGFLSSVSYPHRATALCKTYCTSQRRKILFVLNHDYLCCIPVVILKLIYVIYNFKKVLCKHKNCSVSGSYYF